MRSTPADDAGRPRNCLAMRSQSTKRSNYGGTEVLVAGARTGVPTGESGTYREGGARRGRESRFTSTGMSEVRSQSMKAVYETGSMLVDVVGRVLRRRPSIPRGGDG